ncbi:MAG: DUF4349 domain-containing protein [Gemmatimonas sp.]
MSWQRSTTLYARVLVAAALPVIASACTDRVNVDEVRAEATSVDSTVAVGMMAFGGASPPAPDAAADRSTAFAATAPARSATPQSASTVAIVAPTMVIRNGAASLEVDSMESAIVAVRKLASSLGGYVGNTTLTAGAYAVRSAELQLRIPAARYDEAVGGLAPIGKVESQVSNAQDVGEEFVDVTARQTNARRLEERLITLLATRTGKLEDVLAVERELARVREEIERYEGRLRYLTANVATSTLNVTVHEQAPVVSQYTGRSVIIESFKRAWTNFVQFLALLISSLGWVLPIAGLSGVAVVGLKRLRSRRRSGHETL